jgi:hypothetical protein
MMGEDNGHSIEQLHQWATAVEKEIEKTRGEIAPLDQRLKAALEKLDLIRRLIRLTEGVQLASQTVTETGSSVSTERVGSPPGGKQDLEAHLEQILGEVGKPMHISEIRQTLVERAVPLPGRGDEANIIVRLRRAPERFRRTGRGMYALAALGLEAVPPARRRRRIRLRRKA